MTNDQDQPSAGAVSAAVFCSAGELSEAQLAGLKESAKPLMDWLLKNCHPHTRAIVDSQVTEVLEGMTTVWRKELPERTGYHRFA